jgi:hypothetical protein
MKQDSLVTTGRMSISDSKHKGPPGENDSTCLHKGQKEVWGDGRTPKTRWKILAQSRWDAIVDLEQGRSSGVREEYFESRTKSTY